MIAMDFQQTLGFNMLQLYKIKTSFSNENVVTNQKKKGFESEQKGMRSNTPKGFDLCILGPPGWCNKKGALRDTHKTITLTLKRYILMFAMSQCPCL